MRENRTALITAGASGLGLVIAETLSKRGVAIHIFDQDESAISEAQARLPNASFTAGDAASHQDVEEMFKNFTASEFELDYLINNVGIAGPAGVIDDIEPTDWDRTLAVNLSSAFYVTRLALPLLRATRGVIINISSTAGLFGCPHRSPYVASKWALIGLTKTWAMEYGPEGIRVNAVCPGSIEGPRIDGVIDRDAANRGLDPAEVRANYQNQTSMRTLVTADDVAETVAFLCSDAARHISGQALAVDGHTETLASS
jgi:NAD(P)-dependent dehydrogenase (short-subunit alcohol dehydrogenase family)